jgi:hypothetical protein
MSVTTCAACSAPLKDGIVDVTNYACETCGSTRWDTRVTVEPVVSRISAFAFQHYAKDFYAAYKKLEGDPRFSPARLTLLAQAIELSAKSLHVHQGKKNTDLKKKINHSLVEACAPAILGLHGIESTSTEKAELKKISDLNEVKAFEYPWFDGSKVTPELPGVKVSPELSGVMKALKGWQGLPDESVLEGLLLKLLEPKL